MQYNFVILHPKNQRNKMQDINFDNIHRFGSLIAQTARIAIVTHMRPDGDAMGSSTAMYHFLSMLGKKEHKIIIPDPYPAYLDFITSEIPAGAICAHSTDKAQAESALAQSDLIICLDFNAFHRTDAMAPALESSKAAKVLIDHHIGPDRESFAVSFSETQISSASELLYHILMAFPQIDSDASRLPAACATALMTGMTTDTNNFANSVYPSTLGMASSLLAAGVDRDNILSELYNRHSESRLRLMGHMMKDLMKITDDGVAYIVLDTETMRNYKVQDGETEGFVNMPLSIGKVRMSLLLKEEEDRIRVSIRSKKGTSANRCARMFFNGGGHENAAGGRLNKPGDVATIAEVPEYIEKYTHIYLTEYE